MRAWTLFTVTLTFGVWLAQAGPAQAQGPAIPDAECQSLRQRLGEHARLSEGVRRMVAAQVAAAPAAPPGSAGAAAAPTGRADVIRARLEQIPKERAILEDQRLAAVVKFDLSRATQIQAQIQALDAERPALERELAALPAGAPAAAVVAPAPLAARIRCQDMPAAVDSAVKIRRRELGAREEQAGAIPLIGLTGQTPEQIGQELARQFPVGPAAGASVGLLDSDGDARLDGFVDVPAPGVFRLVRQRADGTVGVEVFPAPGSGAAAGYGEMTRRLDETAVSRTAQTVPELLATRPASPLRGVTQTPDFVQAFTQFQAGSFADAARLGAAAARSAEFDNLRGERVRLMEIIGPTAGGLIVRRVLVLSQPNDQEVWEETTTVVRPTSYWRTDVEVARSREARTTAGAPVGTPVTSAPAKFTLER